MWLPSFTVILPSFIQLCGWLTFLIFIDSRDMPSFKPWIYISEFFVDRIIPYYSLVPSKSIAVQIYWILNRTKICESTIYQLFSFELHHVLFLLSIFSFSKPLSSDSSYFIHKLNDKRLNLYMHIQRKIFPYLQLCHPMQRGM